MLFKVTDKDIRVDNPEIDAIPEFKALSDRNLKYIFLVYDYESPYRLLPLEKKKERVAHRVGFRLEKDGFRFDKNARDLMNGKNARINDAIRAFRDLLFDSDRETYQSVCDLITNIRDFIRQTSSSAGEYQKKVAMAEKLPRLEETKKSLAQILGIREEVVEDTSKKDEQLDELSTLDLVNQGDL